MLHDQCVAAPGGLDGRVLFCNRAALEVLGVPLEAVTGRLLGELGVISDSHDADAAGRLDRQGRTL